MISNYFKVALRTFLKQKGYSFINVFGLAIGLTCFILINLFVQFEFSYDRFHEKSDRIYRVAKAYPESEFSRVKHSTATPEPLSARLREDFPEVEYVTQISKANSLIENGEKGFYSNGIYATADFLNVFTFPTLAGNPSTALTEPNSIVLSESLKEKLFGDANPIGEILTVYTLSSESRNDFKEMTVTAVIQDPPSNSHLSFEYITPTSSSHELNMWIGNWGSNSYLTYVALYEGQKESAFAEKLSPLAQAHLSGLEYYQEHPGQIGQFYSQPLTDIHLHSNITGEFQANGDIKYVYLFLTVSFLILLMACINYVNLSTARSISRSMEVGVRKVMGARRTQLIGQFMSEALIPTIFALLVALMLVTALLPTLSELTGREIMLSSLQLGGFIWILLFVGLTVGILAGGYPSIMMASFNPVRMMKRELSGSKGKASLRNTLVVVQFTVSIVLILAVIVIQRQLNYVQDANTGIDREQIIVIENEDRSLFDERYRTLKQSLLSNPDIVGVSAAQTNATNIDASGYATEWEGVSEGQSVTVHRSIIQHGFVDLFGLELVEGRDFSEAMPQDEREGMLINETLRRQLGWESAVGKWFNFHGREARITGVLKDYNFHSFHHEITPLALFLDSGWWFPYQKIYVKVNADNMQETIAYLEQTMSEYSPSYPFTYSFLDDVYNQMYQTEVRLGTLFGYFTLLAIVIACLGLLGLASLMVQQRTKEIGVRKVLGASLVDILVLLTKDYTRLVAVAFVLAVPLGYFIQSMWLQEFAYRISIGWDTFIIAGGIVLLISWLTISYQSMQAALSNPVNSLSHE